MALSIDDLLRRAVESKSSDLHLKVGNHPYLRVDGLLTALADVPRITPEEMLSMAFSMMTNRQKQKFKETAELDMAYGVAGLGRFRVNVFQQRGNVGMVLRVIPTKIRTWEELDLPRVVRILTSSWSAKCATSKPFPPPCSPPKPATWCSPLCTLSTPRKPFSASSPSSRLPSRSRSAC